jgi:hypothetical protein
MQWLFARNRGDVTLPTRVDSQTEKIGAAIERGGIGVGTHGSQAEFRDIRVTQGDRTLFSSDFSGNSPEWRTFQGDWQRRNGSYAQVSRNTERDMTGTVVDFLAYAGDPNWTDYTVSLRARRIAATGDFVVMFRAKDNRNSWFALHVGSSGAYIERNYEQIATRLPGSSPLAIETGRWYQVRIDVQGPRIQSFLDGKPLVSVDNGYSPIELPTMVAGATRLENSGEILLKVVNFLDKAQRAAVRLDGVSSVAPEGTETVLSSASQEDENSLDQPKRVAPVSRHVAGLSRQFDYTFAANSVTFLRIRATK